VSTLYSKQTIKIHISLEFDHEVAMRSPHITTFGGEITVLNGPKNYGLGRYRGNCFCIFDVYLTSPQTSQLAKLVYHKYAKSGTSSLMHC
jgi:hypothetical protein